MRSAPDKELVLEDLSSLITFVHKTLEAAIQNAIMFFRQKGRDVCMATLPDIVRYEAKIILEQEQEDFQYTLDDLSRNGLYIHYKGYHIKILMADSGSTPNAGRSHVKQQFYSQLCLPSPFSDIVSTYQRRGIEESSLNLLFTWEAHTSTGILSLKLVCPKFGDSNRTVLYWEEEIKHPALSLANEEVSPVYAGIDDDLGISLPNMDEMGNQMG